MRSSSRSGHQNPWNDIYMLKKLIRRTQRVRQRFETKGIILMYHRIAEVKPDPWSLCVAPRHFEQHLQVLKENAQPLQLSQFCQCISNGNLPQRWFSITMDDGYADNFQNAKSLLERYKIPATFFITANIIGSHCEFWWDELEKIFLEPCRLPETLNLEINGNFHQWSLGESTVYTQRDFKSHKTWSVESTNDPTPRHSIYRDLHRLIMQLPENKRFKAIHDLLNWAGISLYVRPSFRPMSTEEISALGKMDLIEIGSHSITHSNLVALNIEQQNQEVLQSKAMLENIVRRPVKSFSYPYGSYSLETVEIVRNTGYQCATSVSRGIVNNKTDAFLLPRMMVEDMDGESFKRMFFEVFKN